MHDMLAGFMRMHGAPLFMCRSSRCAAHGLFLWNLLVCRRLLSAGGPISALPRALDVPDNGTTSAAACAGDHVQGGVPSGPGRAGERGRAGDAPRQADGPPAHHGRLAGLLPAQPQPVRAHLPAPNVPCPCGCATICALRMAPRHSWAQCPERPSPYTLSPLACWAHVRPYNNTAQLTVPMVSGAVVCR